MSKASVDSSQLGRADAAEQVPDGAPSRLEKGDPQVARTAGLVGLSIVLLAIGITILNVYLPERSPFVDRGWMLRIWFVLGLVGMLVHASQETDVTLRRGYGLLSYASLFFGAILVSFALVHGWVSAGVTAETLPTWMGASSTAGIIAGLLGIILTAATAAPLVQADVPAAKEYAGWQGVLRGFFDFFPRWWQGLSDSSRVQQVTVAGVFSLAVFLIAGLLIPPANLLPYALGALGLGFVFMVPVALNESDTNWRNVGVYLLGAIGTIAATFLFSSSFTDLLGLPSYVLPYGVIAGVCIGFPFLCAFIGLQGTDSDGGYRTAQILGIGGILLLGIALVRSLIPPLATFFDEDATLTSYLLPSGFFLIAVGALYALLGATLASDNRLLVMMRRELAALFFSPIAYAVLAGMACMAWLAFVFFVTLLTPERLGQQGPMQVAEPIIRIYYLGFLPLFCLIAAVPMLTMRLLSEEQRTGTLEVLLVAPVTETAVVLSKFLAAWFFFLLAWGTWAVYPLALRYVGEEPFDIRPMLSFYLGMGVMSAAFISMGLFFSSLTRNQIVAFLLTFAGMLVQTALVIFLFQAQDDPMASQTKREALGYVSYYHHLEEFVQGRVHLRFVLFHLSLCVFWLFMTTKVLEARKWR